MMSSSASPICGASHNYIFDHPLLNDTTMVHGNSSSLTLEAAEQEEEEEEEEPQEGGGGLPALGLHTIYQSKKHLSNCHTSIAYLLLFAC
jgi:hypothetical protein